MKDQMSLTEHVRTFDEMNAGIRMLRIQRMGETDARALDAYLKRKIQKSSKCKAFIALVNNKTGNDISRRYCGSLNQCRRRAERKRVGHLEPKGKIFILL